MYINVHDAERARKNAQDRFPVRFLEASPRLELGMRILQTLALPLGYDAVILERVLWIWHPLHPVCILRCCGAGLVDMGSTSPCLHLAMLWSGRRDSDPRLSPWQGDTLPLSHSRRIDCLNNISKECRFGNKFLILFCSFQKFCCKPFKQITPLQDFCTFYRLTCMVQ